MNVSAPLLSMLLDFANVQGMNVEKLKCHLSDFRMDLCDEKLRVPASQYFAILKDMIEQSTTENLGLAYGCYLNLKALGVIHKISLHTSSIKQAIHLLKEYLASNFPIVQINSQVDGGKLMINISVDHSDEILVRNILDSTICLMYRELKLMGGDENITVEVPVEYIDAFGDCLETECVQYSSYRLTADASLLDKNINSTTLRHIGVLLPQFIVLTDYNPFKTESFSRQVWLMVLNMAGPELPTLRQVCQQFAVSERSFQRKLTQEGTSYRKVTNMIKKHLSSYLVEEHSLKTQEIAHLMGYADSSAYLHAAKSWYA